MVEEPNSLRAATDPFEAMQTIEEAALAGRAAAGRVPALATLIGRSDYAHRFYSDHALIGEQAAYAIRQIGVAPDLDRLRELLADPRILEFPVACYDQGTYVGDYATRNVAPAGLAAMLVPLLGVEGLRLFRELATNAANAHDEIAEPARAAIDKLLGLLTGAEEPEFLTTVKGEAEAMTGAAEAGDIAKACLKRLDELKGGV